MRGLCSGLVSQDVRGNILIALSWGPRPNKEAGIMDLHTPLHAEHLGLGARMVSFGGWDMPLHYGSQIEEHLAVRAREIGRAHV